MVKDDYKRAGIPMLPVAQGEKETAYLSLLYTISLLAITALPAAFRHFGTLYLASALLLGAVFLWYALALHRSPNVSNARALYRYSTLYLALLFLALVVDRAVV
jgi:protoheme IX farnesyltransferase